MINFHNFHIMNTDIWELLQLKVLEMAEINTPNLNKINTSKYLFLAYRLWPYKLNKHIWGNHIIV